jgi:hemolysin D
MASKQDRLVYEFLPAALEIEETPPSPLGRVIIWIIFFIVVATLLWSYYGKIDEVAVARGKIIPDGRVKVIQPMEEGKIRAIHVEEGQKVKEGQLLIELDTTIKQADVEVYKKELDTAKLEKEMLMAELNGQDPDIIVSQKNLADAVQIQRRLKEARESEYKAREETLKLIISQREDSLQAAETTLRKLENEASILKNQVDSYEKLYESGALSKMDLLNKQKELYSAEQDIETQKKLVQKEKDGINEAKENLNSLKKERDKSILNDIMEKEKAIASIEGELTKAQKNLELQQLTSPVNGTIHGLSSYTIGGVVTPAQPIVTIVPEGTPLIVEATVLNKDIGFVKVGQEAEVKFDTFPFQKYGTIKGKVVYISPDAVEDEKLGPVYKMKVKLEKASMQVDGKEVSITPGMTVSVEVKTGKRRIIEFFLSPIIKYAKESLTLR